MVFRGKPSGACLLCRQRRIKCDQKPQGCGSCARAGVACTGYRNVESLRICDETLPVAKKHCISQQRKRKSSDPAPHIAFSSFDICSTIQPTRDDFAVAVFHVHYEYCQDSAASPCETHAQSPLLDCMKALGLATYGHWEHTPAFNDDMKKFYLSALKQTNAALASPCCARQNDTLLSVMILSNLETIEYSETGWSAHITGTIALLELRGSSQLVTPYGRLLFMQAATNIISHCFQLANPVPQPVVDLIEEMERYTGVHDYEITLCKMTRARLALTRRHHLIASNISFDVESAIEEVSTLEAAIGEEISDREWHPVPFIDGSRRTFPCLDGPQQILSDFVASQGRTAVLVVRMTLLLLLLKLFRMSSSPYDEAGTYSGMLENIKTELLDLACSQIHLARDYTLTTITSAKPIVHRLLLSQAAVSNSAASFADLLLIQAFSDRDDEHELVCPAHECLALRLSYGYHIIWALALVGYLDRDRADHRDRAARLLMQAERDLGIPQAGVLAKNLIQRHVSG